MFAFLFLAVPVACRSSRARYQTRATAAIMLTPSQSFFRSFRMAYESPQARGRIGAIAVGLCHSHSNIGSEPCLQPTPRSWHCRILNPLSKARDRTGVLMDTSRIGFCCAMTGTPKVIFDGRLWLEILCHPLICHPTSTNHFLEFSFFF